VHNRLSRIFGTTTSRNGDGREEITVAAWAPLVDIIEDDKEYLIKAELPEVKKNDVKVRVENGVLYIPANAPWRRKKKSKRYHRVERAYGSFTRSFSLPEDADAQQVNAEFKDGVLSVHVAKTRTRVRNQSKSRSAKLAKPIGETWSPVPIPAHFSKTNQSKYYTKDME
jgi:HSP20 family protein